MTKTFTTRTAAEEVGYPHHVVLHLYRSGALPEPPRHAGVRVLTAADVERIREILAGREGTMHPAYPLPVDGGPLA